MKSICSALILTAVPSLFVGSGFIETGTTEHPASDDLRKQVQTPPNDKTVGDLKISPTDAREDTSPSPPTPSETEQPVKGPIALRDLQKAIGKTKLPDSSEALKGKLKRVNPLGD